MKKKEDVAFEIGFYEGVLRQRPDYIDALIPLAELYTRVGQHDKGLAIDQKLSKLCQKDPIVHYNLACSYSLCEQVQKAFTALKKAIRLGYQDFEHLNHDPDLRNVRNHEVYGDQLLELMKIS